MISSQFFFKYTVYLYRFHLYLLEKLICYYGTWATYRNSLGKFDVSHINTDLCTHLVYAFAGINTQGTVISLDPYLDLPDNWGRGAYLIKCNMSILNVFLFVIEIRHRKLTYPL